MIHQPEKWQADYQRDGYLVVEDVLDEQTLATLREHIARITDDPDSLPPELRKHVELERDYLQMEGHRKYNDLSLEAVGKAVRNIMEVPKFSRELAELVCYEPLLDVLEAVFESPEFHFYNYKCIVKSPKVSSAFRWHRDLPYLNHTTPNLVTAMLCLDPMTEANGATVVLPGSHRIDCDEVRASDRDIATEDLPEGVEHVTVNCPAGSAVLFHANIIHGGGPNRSDMPRRNVIGIWAGPDNPTKTSFAYGGLHPRSKDPARQAEVREAFPRLFSGTETGQA